MSLDEAVTTMYPLMEQVIIENQSTENLFYSLETCYTSQFLIEAIAQALKEAKVIQDE